jgi:glycosyltransferase involved in cell wall biosynthesis
VAQTYDDYEIVVSDNSEAGCRDLVDSFDDARVRYVRPERQMPLVAHWDFAFAQARGDWQLQLCDDDAITPNLLAVLDKQIRVHPDVQAVCWNQGVYSGDTRSGAPWKANQLGVSAFSGCATHYESSRLLAEMFESGTGLFRVKWRIPFFPRSVCRREVLDAIRARQGRLFHPFCPMTSGAAAVLAFSKSTLHIDLPLRVLGLTVDSCSGWAVDSTTMETSHAGIEVELAPIKQYRILPTAQAESLLRTQRAMPDRLEGYTVNYVNYFVHCETFLHEYEGYGLDAGPFRRVFEAALAKMPLEIQAAVRAAIAAEHKPKRPSLYEGLYKSSRQAARTVIDGMMGARLPGEVDAERLGLSNIFDCAIYVGRLVDRHVASRGVS